MCLVLLCVQGLLEIFKWGGATPVPAPILGFVLFSLATFASVTYSIIPLLSLYKAFAFLLGLIGLVFGIGLRHRARPHPWLCLLATANLVIVLVTLSTILSPNAYDSGLLQGPFVNPNSLGSSLVLTLPGLLWLRELHLREASLLFRSKLLTAAVVMNILLLLLSRSRTSLLAFALVLVIYAGLRASRFAWLIVYGMVVLLLVSPAVASQVGRDAAFKGRGGLQGSVATRIEQFDSTLQAARSNPIAGYGFGTSAGDTSWDGSLSAAAVGREKSNAYLGTIEEVGVVGTLPLMLGIVGALILGFRAARRGRGPDEGAATALVAVIAAGALHVNFEAWLTSIGSFEGFIFWSTMGVLLMNATNDQRSLIRSR